MNIPQSEFDEFSQSVQSHPEYLDTEYVIDKYRQYGLDSIPDPFGAEIMSPIKQALSTGKPLSVIRIGDGETNLLSYGAYPETPFLNHAVVKQIIAMQKDHFKVDPFWMIILRDLMMGALLQADIIGVIGLWRLDIPSTEDIVQRFLKDNRGICGHWRAVDFMLSLAGRGVLRNKTLASAHLYFSVVENLQDILLLTDKVFIISNREQVVEKLTKRYPSVDFECIAVGTSTNGSLPDKPDFLFSTHAALPVDMSGSLSLLGAGPWTEIYCAWIKQRGGVAVDIGSGFDLLDGELTRPIHRMLGSDKMRKYSLVK